MSEQPPYDPAGTPEGQQPPQQPPQQPQQPWTPPVTPPTYQQPGQPYPPQPGQPYPPQPGYYPVAPPTSGKATTALILGIAGLFLCPLILSIPAWIIGHGAVKEIDASQGRLGGRSSAQAGFILGIIGTVLGSLIIIGFIVVAVAVPDTCTSTSTDNGNGFSFHCS